MCMLSNMSVCVCSWTNASSWTEVKVSALYKGLIQSPLLLPGAVPGHRRQAVEKRWGWGKRMREAEGRQRKGAALTWQWQIALYLFKLCNVIFWLCCNVSFKSVWPCWWVNINKLVKRTTQGESKTMKFMDDQLKRKIFKQTHRLTQVWKQMSVNLHNCMVSTLLQLKKNIKT